MPQASLKHPPPGSGASQATAKHRLHVAQWFVDGGPPPRPPSALGAAPPPPPPEPPITEPSPPDEGVHPHAARHGGGSVHPRGGHRTRSPE